MKIKENIKLFLISLIISFIIWYGVSYTILLKVERWEKEIPISISIPNKLVLKSISAERIKIYGKGDNPMEKEISINIPIDKTKEGHYKLSISNYILKFSKDYNIYKIEPMEVDIELEEKITKEVPLVLSINIPKKIKAKIEPKMAKISGGKSAIGKIKEFKVPDFNIPEKLPANILLPLTSPSKEIELLSPSTVEIQIEEQKK